MAIIISSWLKGKRDYKVGVELYLKHGNSQALKDLLVGGKNSYTAKALAEGLKDLIKKDDEILNQPQRPPKLDHSPAHRVDIPKRNIEPAVSENEEVLPAPSEIEFITQQNKFLYSERDYMKYNLRSKPEHLRFVYLEKILANMKQIKENYLVLDHFKATGNILDLSESKKVKELSVAEIDKKILNARSNVSKNKKPGKEEGLAKWKGILDDLMKKREELDVF